VNLILQYFFIFCFRSFRRSPRNHGSQSESPRYSSPPRLDDSYISKERSGPFLVAQACRPLSPARLLFLVFFTLRSLLSGFLRTHNLIPSLLGHAGLALYQTDRLCFFSRLAMSIPKPFFCTSKVPQSAHPDQTENSLN